MFRVRTLTPVEAAVAVSVAGAVLATALPAFVRNLHASKLAEPIEGLHNLALRATAAAQAGGDSRYPASVELTPGDVPAGVRVTDPPGTWDHPTWKALDFGFAEPHAFSFAFESGGTEERAVFRARALGDLDGDGSTSELAVSGECPRGGTPVIHPMDVYREVE